ncbi:glutathione S-transferase family protein [Microbulbifer sp. 2201CG32-9]|uniref:glutathione S-transferase family protein n=1 Tax=Microbulbifer sp. 2201CG32-9 TaxID=3232309 RepID=UPI00345BED44
MVTLHHLEYSQSFRILWLLEELGVDYELKLYRRDPQTKLAPADYKAVSPLGTAPVITDGEFALAETAAIFDYLLDRYPSETLRPAPGSPGRDSYLFWFHAAQGSVMPLMLMDGVFHILQARVPSLFNLVLTPVLNKATDGFIRPRMVRLLALAEEDLAAQEWFGGSVLSGADILLSYPMESASKRSYLTDGHPNTRAWLERIQARPAFRKAQEIDGHESMVLPL